MSARRRILMLTTQLGYGGAETSFIRLANFLAQSMDVTVALFTADYGDGKQYSAGHEPLNAPVVLLDAPQRQIHGLRWLRRIRQLRALKKNRAATISFLSGPNLVNVLAGNNARTIVSLRGSRVYDPTASRRQRLLFQFLLDPIIYAFAARVVPVSDGLKHEVQRVATAKSLDKIRVISPFVEHAAMQRRLLEEPPELYRALQGQPVIVAAGRLSVEKGFQHLIRVVAVLAQTQPGIKLLLIGDGPMMANLRTLCAEYGLAMDDMTQGVSAVIFTGYQKNVLPLMALGGVYAMASATEGFPSVLLEAMAAGVTIMAADTPWGVRSILCASTPDTAEPYPTGRATMADYGTLMPRIDALEYEAIWVEALRDALAKPPVLSSATARRPYDFDLAVVGEKWKALLVEFEAP
jgi:glycosyltransferase involved in cell wall biosynthesis